MFKALFLFAIAIHLMLAGNLVKAQDRFNRKEQYAYGCVIKNKYSVSQRLKRYPFSKAAKILAVSFKYGMPNDSTAKEYDYGLNVADSVLDQRSLIEIKQLSTAQINSLTNIMYNIREAVRGILIRGTAVLHRVMHSYLSIGMARYSTI